MKNTNKIYEKLRTKRKYVRKPKCENKLGMCEFKKCRCEPLNIPKRNKKQLNEKVIEELLHRQKVIEVKRREFLQAIDNEIERMDQEVPSYTERKEKRKTFWKQLLEFTNGLLP